MRINTENLSKIVATFFTYLSKISLSLYFIHIIVEMILEKHIKALTISNSIKVFILFMVSFSISVFLSWITSKIKLIRNKVLLIK